MAIKIEFNFNGSWEEHEAFITDLNTTEVLHKNLKPADSTAAAIMTPSVDLYNKLRGIVSAPIPARIMDGAVTKFIGYLRNNFTIGKTQRLQPVRVELVTASYLLKRKVQQTISYQGTTVTQLVINLLNLAGVVAYTLPTISKSIPAFSLIAGESGTYHEHIEALLFQYGYVGYFNLTGVFVTHKLNPDSIVTSQVFDGSNCRFEIKQSKKDTQVDQAEVHWFKTAQLTNAIVFSDVTNAKNGFSCFIELPAGAYLGESQEWHTELDSPDGEILAVNNLSLNINAEPGIQVLKFEQVGKRALISIRNTTALTKIIRRLDIIAETAIVKKDLNKAWVLLNPGPDKIEIFQANYIYDKDSADNLANILGWYYRYSTFSYQVTSKINYALGSLASVTDAGLGIQTCLIVGKRTNLQTGEIQYDLDAIEAYNPTAAESENTYIQPTPSGVIDSIQTVVQAGLNPDGTLAQPINSNTMITDITPTGDGLYLTKSYIGLRSGGEWKSFIGANGIFSFKGDANNFVQWNGSKLNIKGDLNLSGDSTISGKISTGSIQSNTYVAGTSGFNLGADGSAEFNNVTVRGTVHSTSGNIGGWTLDTASLTGGNLTLANTGNITAGTSDDVVRLSANDSDFRIWAGNATASNAPFRVSKTGALTAISGSIGGTIITTTELKSSNYSAGIAGFLINNTGFAEFNNINVRGNVNSTSGSIGGWNITIDKLVSNITGSRIELNKALNRVSIINTTGVEKVVMGYLSGLAKNSGSGTYTTSDYGFWVAPGDTIIIDGPMKILNGDMTASDASFKVFSGASEIIRVGSDNATQGLHLYSSSKRKSIVPNADSIRIISPSGFIDIGAENTSWAHFKTDRANFYFDKSIQTAGGLKIHNINAEIDSAGKLRIINNAGTFSNTVYVKDSAGYFTERTIQSGVWSFDFNQHLNTTSNVQFGTLLIASGGGANSNTVYIKDSTSLLKERTIPAVAWTNTQATNTNSNVTFAGLTNNGNITLGNQAERSIFIAALPAGSNGRSLTIAAGNTTADGIARNAGGGVLTLSSGQTVGTATSSIMLQTPQPAGAAGTTLNPLVTRVTINSQGVSIVGGSGANTNIVYTKGADTFIKEQTIADGVWAYNYNQNLNTTSDVLFKSVKVNNIDTIGAGIIESGSNANGSYIKYSDGTMVARVTSVYAANTSGIQAGLLDIPVAFWGNWVIKEQAIAVAGTAAPHSTWAGVDRAMSSVFFYTNAAVQWQLSNSTTAQNFTLTAICFGRWRA